MNDTTLGTTYDPHAIERSLYDFWESSGLFAPQGDGSPYCIMIPPPNVTGSLHMGHAFQDTIMDALIRYHRMHGCRTLWQAGTDHAGIATQMVVERQLNAEGRTRHDLGRDAFVERVWQWKAQSGGQITRQLRRMGASLDWSRERFTMDEGLSNAVQEVFVRLYEDGLIYRGKRLVNWDPVLHTAISDLEVVAEEENGNLWHIRYPLCDGSGYVSVATTRPETMLGDTAVAVHPEDERYKSLVGKTVRLPLVEREIPIIADDYVDPDFGSGCVKITPAHDFNDYEIGQRHGLELINVLTPDAAVELPGSSYHGLDRFEARKRIVADLDAAGLLERRDDHRHKIPRGDRSNAVVEPYLTDQWFVKIAPLAEPAIRAVEEGEIRFVPESWSRTYFEWMRNIQDWCISRQLWWGHRIPAWYDDEGNIFVARSEAQARAQAAARHGREVPLERDEDVLDTWFSSALWPFSTLGWPERTPELETFYPTSVLVTGFDIIFFWVARMIMFGLRFTGAPPFHEVYVHGLIRDSVGQKMSKSKGNILDPLDLIDGIDLEELVRKRTTGLMQPRLAPGIEAATRKEFPHGIAAFGADALRFTFASLATQGRDIRFDLGRIEGYRNFCNKLWNAARYVLMNTAGRDCGQDGAQHYELGAEERWIVSRLQHTAAEAEEAVGAYRFDRMAQAVYGFVWDEYCSWYLELSKITLSDSGHGEARHIGTRRTLVRVLEAALRMLHPLMPFITEAIWQKLSPLAGAKGGSIMTQPFPTAAAERIDAEAVAEIRWLQDLVRAIRNIRGEMNVSPTRRIAVLLQDTAATDRERLRRNEPALLGLAALEGIETVPQGTAVPESATALVGDMKVLVPLGAVIDKNAELERLQKKIDKLQNDLTRSRSKLDNPRFVERAPVDVVAKERERITAMQTALEELGAQREKIRTLDAG